LLQRAFDGDVAESKTEPASPFTATDAPPSPAKRTETGNVVESGVGLDCATAAGARPRKASTQKRAADRPATLVMCEAR
jgi:hypothetical protein